VVAPRHLSRSPPSCPWRHTAGPLGASSPAPRCPSRMPPSCPALGLSRSPCRSRSGAAPAPPGPLPVLPDRKTNGRRPHPAGCLPLCPAPLSLPLRLRPPASPVPQRSASLPLPCLFHPGVAAAPRSALPSRQIDKRRAPAPRRMPAALSCPSVSPAPSASLPFRSARYTSRPPSQTAHRYP